MQGVGEQREHRQSHIKIANLDWPLNCRREAGGIWLQALEGFFAGR
jgi:hypothetical protein